jgi:GT2 family glycosyltransferase
MAKISIIIVNYNGERYIGKCLECLQRNSGDSEIIVVDNASQDGSLAVIHSKKVIDDRVIPVSLPINRGFTGGNIEGFRLAKGDYICLLNPDTEVASDWLANLVKVMDENPQVGICASKLLVYETDNIDSAGDGCTVTGRGFKIGEGENQSHYNKPGQVFGACGGAMLIRRVVIDQIGFLDDTFFLIHEDTDFNFRTNLAGWQCRYVPEAVVQHKVRSSIGAMSDTAVYYSVRNAKYVLLKNMSWAMLLKYLPVHLLQEIASFYYFAIRHGKWNPYLKANYDFIRAIPLLLAKRREVMKMKKIDDKTLGSMLTPLFDQVLLRKKINKLIRG